MVFASATKTRSAGLFSDVLRLCADAGLAGAGLVAVDGTELRADASHHANRDYEQITTS